MTLPLSRSTTYVQGTTPPISADDLNDLQDTAANAWSQIRGNAVHFVDHFLKSSIDTGFWTEATSSGTVTLFTDYTNGANGAIELSATADSSSAAIYSPDLGIGADFWFSGRSRVVSIGANPGTGGGTAYLGGLLKAGGDGLSCCIVASTAGVGVSLTNFMLMLSTSDTVDTFYDTGVAFDTAYHDFDIRRVSGAVTVYIDGSSVLTETSGRSFKTTNVRALATNAHLGGGVTFGVDRLGIWFPE